MCIRDSSWTRHGKSLSMNWCRDSNQEHTTARNGFCLSIGSQVWNNERKTPSGEVRIGRRGGYFEIVCRSISYYCCVVLRPGFEPGICDSKGHNAWPYCAAGMNQLLHHRSNRQVIQILGHKIFSWSEKNEKFHNLHCHPQTRGSKYDSRGIGEGDISMEQICRPGIW